MEKIDIKHLKGWIGRTTETKDLVTERLAEGFRAAFEPHLAPVKAGEAPLGLHWCLAPLVAPMSELGPDGHPTMGSYLPPVPLPRRMWAGGEIEISAPLRIGDQIARKSTIADVVAKEGRSGPLCFVKVEHELATERGIAIRERQDIVYRQATPNPAKPSREVRSRPELQPAEVQHTTWSVNASPVLLFRYSALTFNGHRIHYDLPYTTETEGYPGLVVHGPLQATLLLNLAATIGDRAPLRCRYRGLAPLIAGQTFEVHGRTSGDKFECWTRDATNRLCMEAEATW